MKSDINRFLEIHEKSNLHFVKCLKTSQSLLFTANVDRGDRQCCITLCSILLWFSPTTSYLNKRTRPLLEMWLGKYSPLLLCVFIIPSCTVETNTQVYLLSHNKQHSIYLYHFPVTFPYCTSSSFFRLMTMIIKMTEDDLCPRGFLIKLIKCLKKSLIRTDCNFSVMMLWM